jgi:hypothetical protein
MKVTKLDTLNGFPWSEVLFTTFVSGSQLLCVNHFETNRRSEAGS